MVADELHERAIRIAEIDAGAFALPAEARHRSQLDLDAVGAQMLHRTLDRAVPAETEIAVSGLDRDARQRLGLHARPVAIQLLAAQPENVGATFARNRLGTDDFGIERPRPIPVGNMDHTVIERYRQDSHGAGTTRRAFLPVSRRFARCPFPRSLRRRTP